MNFWLHRGLLARLLWPCSLIYGALLWASRWLYRMGVFASHRFASVQVIVVGNIITGGGGKTPVILSLVTYLQQRGVAVGVVTRGYGRSCSHALQVHHDTPAMDAGDEPLLIHRHTGAPVFVASKRADAVAALLRTYPKTQVVLCDDGLQHWALQRNLEIAVFDDRGLGNGWLLPAGPLREPWPRQVDLVLHTGKRAVPGIPGFQAQRHLAHYACKADGSQVAWGDLIGQPLYALAGIAHPPAFFAMLHEQGLQLEQTFALPDHYPFKGYQLPHDKGYLLICTEKDAVKLWAGPLRDRVLAAPLVFTPEPAFWAALDQKMLGTGATLEMH